MQTFNYPTRYLTLLSLLLGSLCFFPHITFAADGETLKAKDVLESMSGAQRYLRSQQHRDGSWVVNKSLFPVGTTSMVVMSLINSGLTKDDPAVKKGLVYLRKSEKSINNIAQTYETSLLIMALASAKDGIKDKRLISRLARKIESSQVTKGSNAGGWSYTLTGRGSAADRSNTQFAILGLRDAAHMGYPVSQTTWKIGRKYWVTSQNHDGGWGYSSRNKLPSTGSMTCAGISSLVITERMIAKDPKKDLTSDGKPNCCGKHEEDAPLEKGVRWMGSHFQKGHNPAGRGRVLYYLYAMERAGRLSGRRFFGKHDWYREVAEYLVKGQSPGNHSWQGDGSFENDPVGGTSLALLFLSKGLAPVLIHKLKHGPNIKVKADTSDWNRHHDDVRNLTEHISTRQGWPKLLTWQMIDLKKVEASQSLQELLQAPVLLIAGRNAPVFSDTEILLLRNYIEQGGFIFAVRNCGGAGFDKGIRSIVRRMYPKDEDAKLKRLNAEHPIFRSEHLLNAETVELYGVDLGCRTSFIYSPQDISCLWEKWMRQDPVNRTIALKGMITKANRIGVNVIAYATGREPPNKLKQQDIANQKGTEDQINRGLLQVAKLRHAGGWDAAPHALRNLLIALNKTVGLSASTKQINLPASDPKLYQYPIVYMHGRHEFSLSQKEKEQLKKYLENGGLLFSDACCGSKKFDISFRQLVKEIYPEKKLKRIPADHELFTEKVGHDIRQVKRRAPETANTKTTLKTAVKSVEPFLEGIEINGRYVVIYSKYDISCALERQASVACAGYIPLDATRIAINIILYAMLQDVTYSKLLK